MEFENDEYIPTVQFEETGELFYDGLQMTSILRAWDESKPGSPERMALKSAHAKALDYQEHLKKALG